MNKSHLLINEPALQVLPSLAIALGLEEAIILQQLHYWLNNQRVDGREHDGRKWIYNSYEEWQENFPFWSVQQIQRFFLNLEKTGVVISAKLDAKRHDQTKFYTLDYDILCTMDGIKIESSKVSKSDDVKMNQRLPENTSNRSTSKTEILATASLEWTLAADEQVTQEQVDTANLKDTAPKMFEKALGFSKPLPWWNGKDWTDFAEWVCAEYSRSKTSFGEYNVWRNTPYVKGGIANTRLRGFPNEFYDSWDMFRMANPDKPKVQHKVYRPEEHEEPKYVPAPPRKR